MLGCGAAVLAAGAARASDHETPQADPVPVERSAKPLIYIGGVPPMVAVQAATAADPFAGFDRIMAMMEARHRAMMMQLAALQNAAAQGSGAQASSAVTSGSGPLMLVGNLPVGAHYTMVSSTTDASGCTRTVRYSSDGGSEAPRMTQASAGNCDDASGSAPATIAVSAVPEQPSDTAVTGREV